MKNLFLFLICISTISSIGQTAWTWTPLENMPVRVSNNAVAFGSDGSSNYVYSFGGIDSSKVYTGVNNRSFRYTIETNSWEEIAPLPFERENIAAAANTVNGIIYIIGGYHVLPDGSEITSNEVIRYSPTTNSYLSNGAEIPTPIDDQVQCVWRDSLIYVITGWSNTGNVRDVQIYNTYTDEWTEGTDTPITMQYEVFGGSGQIIGDTIYYYGGAANGFNFPAQQRLRKGVINPENPSEIEWSLIDEGPNALYRSACIKHGDNVFWVGGSSTSYNYNGIAYNGSGGVSPLTQIMRYDQSTSNWYAGEGAPYGIMDLRGAAQLNDTEWIITGGMEDEQYVTNKTFLLTYDPVVGQIKEDTHHIQLIDNKIVTTQNLKSIELLSVDGKTTHKIEVDSAYIPEEASGFLLIRIVFEDGSVGVKQIIR